MLNISKNQAGFTMIEILLAVSIVSILFAVAAPSFFTWTQNTKIRTASDAIFGGLQLARSEAVKRNASVRFQLTDSLTNGCALVTNSSNWIVSLNDPTGKCANTPAEPPPSPAAPDPANPYIIQSRSAAAGSANVTVAADVSTLIFNGLGRLTPTPAGNINIDTSNSTGGSCAASGGPMRCLKIFITPGGLVKMCDPTKSGTSQGCT